MSNNLLSISSLPLPPSSHLLIHNLIPDPHTPSPSEFRSQVLTENPSIQRRARLISSQSHFSHVLPLPLPFPYEINASELQESIEDKATYIEKWLSAREARQPRPKEKSMMSDLTTYDSDKRDQPRELIGLAETVLRDCFPQLDVGDAFETLGKPALLPAAGSDGQPTSNVARQELIDVLSGHAVLMSSDDSKVDFAPWSLRYSVRQLSSRLGDCGAISILVTPHPSDPELTYELQLKGCGRTPFLRSADGLAVLRSSIREFLCSEAMHALRIPTTRSLSLIALPSLQVTRERLEPACILTHSAPSFIRIGFFEAFNPSQSVLLFGGGQQEADWEGLRILGEWVGRRVLRLEGIKWRDADEKEGSAWGRELVMEVARRNAKMVAAWQAYGFMHGVMNTNNISVLGLTIDYGPFAFMDVFDPYHICNHSDEEGRYPYKYQPNMMIFACRHLLTSLAPLIGAESALGNKAVGPGWAQGASNNTINGWRKCAIDSIKDEMEILIPKVFSVEYGQLMRKRLALRRQDTSDERKFVQPLLNIMEEHKLDFHGTFRKLSSFSPALLDASLTDPNKNALERFIIDLLALSSETETMNYAKATKDWMAWLEAFSERILSEKDEWNGANFDREREKAAKEVNPRFVLRHWVLEEIVKMVEKDIASGKKILGKVLQMACNPYEPWGAEGDERSDHELEPEVREERRLCGMGARAMVGFQR